MCAGPHQLGMQVNLLHVRRPHGLGLGLALGLRLRLVWHVRRPHLLEAKRLVAAHLESIPGEMVQPHPGRPKQVPSCSRPPVRPPTPPEARPLAEGCAPAVPLCGALGSSGPRLGEA